VSAAVAQAAAQDTTTRPPVAIQDSAAQTPQQQAQPQPGPGAGLVISLLTMGPGGQIWEKFGHNALRVRDTLRNVDVVYNWGLFSFSEPGFLQRLMRGEMYYWMGADRSVPFINWYRRDDRQIWEQVLNLSEDEKVDIFQRARDNDTDLARYYRYNYYLDNCSTRIRDLLNSVLGGQLRDATDTLFTGATYRDHTRRLLAGSQLPYFGIQLVLGRPADAPITRWDEMFLPVRMMRYLNDVHVVSADGNSIVPLVASQTVLHRALLRGPESEVVQPKTLQYLAIGAVVAALLLLSAASSARSAAAAAGNPAGDRAALTARAARRAAIAFAAVAALWCLFAGLFGTAALGMWLFTKHTFMHWNQTVLLLNPLALAAAVYIPRAAIRSTWARRDLILAALVAITAVVAVLLHFMPGMGQRNEELIVLAVAPGLALFAGVLLISRAPHHESRHRSNLWKPDRGADV
jgi:hypothetical protein